MQGICELLRDRESVTYHLCTGGGPDYSLIALSNIRSYNLICLENRRHFTLFDGKHEFSVNAIRRFCKILIME